MEISTIAIPKLWNAIELYINSITCRKKSPTIGIFFARGEDLPAGVSEVGQFRLDSKDYSVISV